MMTEAVNALCTSAERCWCFKSPGPMFWIALQVYNSLASSEIYHQKLHSSVFRPANHKAKAEGVRNTLPASYPDMKMSATWCISLVPLTWAAVFHSLKQCQRLKAPWAAICQGSLFLVLHIWGYISHKAVLVSGKHTMPAYIMHFFDYVTCLINRAKKKKLKFASSLANVTILHKFKFRILNNNNLLLLCRPLLHVRRSSGRGWQQACTQYHDHHFIRPTSDNGNVRIYQQVNVAVTPRGRTRGGAFDRSGKPLVNFTAELGRGGKHSWEGRRGKCAEPPAVTLPEMWEEWMHRENRGTQRSHLI